MTILPQALTHAFFKFNHNLKHNGLLCYILGGRITRILGSAHFLTTGGGGGISRGCGEKCLPPPSRGVRIFVHPPSQTCLKIFDSPLDL